MEKWRLVRDSFKQSGLKKTLLEVMLWNLPGNNKVSVAVDGEAVEVEVLAELPGAAFLQVPTSSRDASRWFRQVDKELSKRFPERIVRFQHSSGDSWFWPKKLSSGSLSYERLVTKNNDIPDYLAQRLAGLSFTQRDHNTLGVINPISVREKIRGQFESSKVTSDFFKKFRAKHELLTSQIVGIEDQSEASSYSTLILNRLMFIYFLQKKEFLNGDPDYLKTCLAKVRELRGEDKFYSFYKDYLLELFFNKLDNPSGKIEDPAIHEIAGDIPYVNGGVFSRSPAEEKFEIEIPDSAFEEIFSFFDSYTWHLDTRPTGTANEINPEVIGYIFEQYINFTAGGKKENGAYYTKHDVTGYMVGQTLVPRILDDAVNLGMNVFPQLTKDPDAYIFESLKHGWDSHLGAWRAIEADLEECWNGDPIGWSHMDSIDTDPELCLPDETWVETFARRERVEDLRGQISKGEIREVNGLITHNLNSEKLLTDVIAECDDAAVLEDLWGAVSNLKIIDPTCGSGAFLFAALEVLEVFYGNLLDRLGGLKEEAVTMQEMKRHPNRRYFLRKHAALRNLFGADIMPDAIETAKLRIFLALASCLETKSQLEPLPDLDFNLKVGNLVVGFVNSADVARVEDGRLIIDNQLEDIEESMADHIGLYEAFVSASSENGAAAQRAKVVLQESELRLRAAADEYYAECTGKDANEYGAWAQEARPFHWSIEFPAVFANGGFDVVIGNPPYIKKSEVPAVTRQSMIGFKSQGLPDFYAVCLERSDQLRNTSSRKAMIVMLSLAFSAGFEISRQGIYKTDLPQSSWVSTFGKRPDALFRGVQVRNTILIQGVGSDHSVTSHNIFNGKTRGWLFESLRYSPVAFSREMTPIRAGGCFGLASKFPLAPNESINKSDLRVFLRPTGSYWLPVLPGLPPVLSSQDSKILEPEDSRVNDIPLWDGEDPNSVVALLAGKLGFLWWSSTGDDFDTMVSQTIPPRLLMNLVGDSPALRLLADKVLAKAHTAAFGSKNAAAIYVNVRWTDLNQELDEFARELLAALGLLEEWRPLCIWYRMTMRSSGENTNSVEISSEISRKFLSNH